MEYTSLRSTIAKKNLSWQHEEFSDRVAVWAIDGTMRIESVIWKPSAAVEGINTAAEATNLADFRANYEAISGFAAGIMRRYPWSDYPTTGAQAMFKKFKYSVLGNETKSFSEKFTHTVWLSGGEYEVIGVAHKDSYIEFRVTDEDNLLGYGVGFSLAQYVYTEYLLPNRQWASFNSDGAKEIPPGFYLSMRYVGAGATPANDIEFRVRYNLRRP